MKWQSPHSEVRLWGSTIYCGACVVAWCYNT